MSIFSWFYDRIFGSIQTVPADTPPEAVQTMPQPVEPTSGGNTALEIAAGLAKEYEGFSSSPYLDPDSIPTQGYGSTRDGDGNPITMDHLPLTEEVAFSWLMRDMQSAFDAIAAAVTVPLTVHQRAALGDLVYNIGRGNFGTSTLLKYLNLELYDLAAKQFPAWDMEGGKVLPGLVNRRAAEMALFNTPDAPSGDLTS